MRATFKLEISQEPVLGDHEARVERRAGHLFGGGLIARPVTRWRRHGSNRSTWPSAPVLGIPNLRRHLTTKVDAVLLARDHRQ